MFGHMFHMHFGLVPVIWGKEFENGPSKICGRQPLKNLK